MKWFRRRPPDTAGHDRADEALERTAERLQETLRRDEVGHRLARRIREMRERNHLAEAIERALREGR